MMHNPKTMAEALRYRYGAWAGNPAGTGNPFDPKRCAAAVWDDMREYQCQRKPGHGPDGLYCKQHAKMVEGSGK